jgi:putative membrane protein insertion efficiency factor
MLKIFIYLITLYQKYVSPLLVNSCRFYPTCSQYAKQSLEKHGLVRGIFYSLIRLLKCHPFHPGGYDPIK